MVSVRRSTTPTVHRFLWLVGYYRSFCCNFSYVVAPLTTLLSPSQQFDWTDACQYEFDSIKHLLFDASVLAVPNFVMPFKLEVNTSAVGVRAVLLQDGSDGI